MKAVSLLIATATLFLAQPSAARAQAEAAAPLPPAAQQAVEKGIIAARTQDYLLAIRYFEQARKIAPEAPVIYMDLGLAEAKVPGRELRAIAWFGAYLAAVPAAPNAAAVKDQITTLEVRNESNILRLIRTLQDASLQVTDPFWKDVAMCEVAKLWAKAGDFAAAVKIAGLIHDTPVKDHALGGIVKAQAAAGDIAGARHSADLISPISVETKGSAKLYIADAQQHGPDWYPAGEVHPHSWLSVLDDRSRYLGLNQPMFLDLDGYLKSLPLLPLSKQMEMTELTSMPPDNPLRVFLTLGETAGTIVFARNNVTARLKKWAAQ